MPKQYVHIHIPKTAGTSMTNYLRALFGVGRVAHFGHRGETAQFRAMSIKELRRFRCIGGHIPYRTLIEKLGTDPFYFTVVRDPFDLFVSYYSDIVKRKTHPLHELARTNSQMSFLEIIAKENLLRPQTFYVSLTGSLDEALELIEQGKIAADSLPNVNRLLSRIAKLARKRSPEMPRHNVSVRAPIKDEEALREAVDAYYADDRALVAFVEAFNERNDKSL